MSFKILVRTAPSMFLDTLVNLFEDQPYTLIAPSLSELDWTDAKAAESYIRKTCPSIVINNSLVPLQGNAAEVKSLTRIVQQCDHSNIPVIHISSYRVFGELENDVDLV